MNHNSFHPDFIRQCRERLIEKKSELLNRIRAHRMDFESRRQGGDEADQSVALLEENHLLITNQRIRSQLLEVEAALGRIERGTYGICEETGEPIEENRLVAIPWTRLSVEGAEMREHFKKNARLRDRI